MKFLAQYLRPFYNRMYTGLAIKFVGTIMDLFLPWILAYIIDSVVPTGDINKIILWGIAMLGIAALGLALNIIANRTAEKVSRDTIKSLRNDLFSTTLHLSEARVDKFGVPSLESRLTTDTYNVHRMISVMQRMGVRAPILLLGGVSVTFFLEPVLTLTMLAVLPFIVLIVWGISKKSIPLFTSLQTSLDKMVRVVRENAQGVRIIKALSKTGHEKNKFGVVNSEVVAREKKASLTMAASNPLINALLHIGLTGVIVLGAYRVNTGVSEAGKIIAFMTYFTLISNAMLTITRLFVMYSRGSASATRIRDVLAVGDAKGVSLDATTVAVGKTAKPSVETRPETAVGTQAELAVSESDDALNSIEKNISGSNIKSEVRKTPMASVDESYKGPSGEDVSLDATTVAVGKTAKPSVETRPETAVGTQAELAVSESDDALNSIEKNILEDGEAVSRRTEQEECKEIVCFEGVGFSYPSNNNSAEMVRGGKRRANLIDINFRLNKGQTIGIIGATGSGKSTIVKLLLRFYNPDTGVIRICGKDINEYSPEKLYEKFGVVFQNDFLYADTISENIRFGRDISPDKIKRAAEISQAKEFVDALDDGYDHMLAVKGRNLSGGQQQRLLIARAVASDPEILILDDSSSALDYRTDANLRAAISNKLKDTTTVVVAQRISSIMYADLIIVLDHGEIVCSGTHDELIENCGIYKEISDSQLGGVVID